MRYHPGVLSLGVVDGNRTLRAAKRSGRVFLKWWLGSLCAKVTGQRGEEEEEDGSESTVVTESSRSQIRDKQGSVKPEWFLCQLKPDENGLN
ncbi:hypothetical protein PoB_003080500 [Plakobranchus ocellatus]|uniref:Uncharacterized protein n=1 Tax=Plakobranchus ocellatus TaxID=259542 RepID=A0AAV4A800_9GAST|nr:hypothetical protein PoB_003080500 [Plakobranchus ocellatus]